MSKQEECELCGGPWPDCPCYQGARPPRRAEHKRPWWLALLIRTGRKLDAWVMGEDS